jgi:tyrosine-protein kinase Etk/Wzc
VLRRTRAALSITMSAQQNPAIPVAPDSSGQSAPSLVTLLDAPIDPCYLRSSRLALLWDRRRLLFDASLWGAALALLIALLSPSRFTSTARLMPPDPPLREQLALLRSLSELVGFSLDSSKAGPSSTFIIPSNVFATILSTDSIQNGVIDKLGLRKVYSCGTEVDARRELSRRTNISVDRKTHFLTIEVTDHDPQRAQQITAEYIAQLNLLLARVDNSASHRERLFLQQRLLEVGHELQGAESDFSRFSAGNFLVDLHDEDSTLQQTVLYLQGQLIAEKTQLQALRTVYADDNAHVHEAQARILELTRQIRQLGGHSNTTLVGSASTAPLIPLRKLPALGVGYIDLLRRVKVDETQFEALARKYEMARAQEARELPSVTVLDSPEIPEKRVFPLRVLMIAAGACLAFLSCVTWIFLKSDWDRLAPEDPAKMLAACVSRPFPRRILS